VGQPRDELGRLLLVLTGRGDAEVGAAPVAALPAREGGDVPLAAAGVAGLALDVADHPGGAGDRGEGAAAEAGVPARVDELLELGGEAVLPGLGGEVERVAEGLVRLEDELAARVVVDLLLGRDDGVVEAAGRVVEGGALRRAGLELLPEREEVLPRAELRGELGRVGRQAGLLEEV